VNFRVIPVFIEVLGGTIANLGAAMRMSWPWLLLLLPLHLADLLYKSGDMASAQQSFSLSPAAVSLAYSLAALLAGSSIAVNWHRYLLLEEAAAERLRLDRLMWRYLGNAFLLLLPLALLMLVFVVPVFMVFEAGLDGDAGKPSLAVELAMVAMIVPFALLQRLSLKFPAIALGRRDYGFGDSWRDTRGYFLRIIGYTLLVSICSTPGSILFIHWTPDIHASLVSALFHALLYTAWTLFLALFTLNTLTVFYDIFAEGRKI
jgi:hypothetical protein